MDREQDAVVCEDVTTLNRPASTVAPTNVRLRRPERDTVRVQLAALVDVAEKPRNAPSAMLGYPSRAPQALRRRTLDGLIRVVAICQSDESKQAE